MNHNARLNAAKAFFQRYRYMHLYIFLSSLLVHSNGYYTVAGSIRDEMSGGANAISHRAAPSLHWHLSSRTPSIFVPEVCLFIMS